MDLIYTHIFSFNRPAQLELLLDSIRKFDTGNRLAVFVQYAYSSNEYSQGYDLLKFRFPEAKFIEEHHFGKKKIIVPLLGEFYFNLFYWLVNYRFRYFNSNFRSILIDSLTGSNSRYVMFLTDDSLFYQSIILDQLFLDRLDMEIYSSYGMAYGKNIIGFNSIFETTGGIKWEFNNANFSKFWGYPFSVDGRIYNGQTILRLLKKLSFSNPNTLETIAVKFNNIAHCFNEMTANYQSCLIGFELNRVQGVYENKNIGLDIAVINKYYLEGYKLKIEFSHPIDRFRPEIHSVFLLKDSSKILLYEFPA